MTDAIRPLIAGNWKMNGLKSSLAEFEAMLATLKENEISQPFQSQFGWHIVQLLGEMTNAHLTAQDVVAAMFVDSDNLHYPNNDDSISSRTLARKTTAEKNDCLRAMAGALDADAERILAANAADLRDDLATRAPENRASHARRRSTYRRAPRGCGEHSRRTR